MGATTEESGRANYVHDVLARLDGLTDRDPIHVRDIVEAFGQASFTPFLMVPALLVVSPLSGVPLFSSVCGLSIALVTLQILARRRHLWLPGFIMSRKLSAARLHRATERLEWVADFLDRRTQDRLPGLVRSPYKIVSLVMCLLAGLAMPVLELVPFSSSILGAAVVFIALSLVARDGLFTVIGMALIAAAAAIAVRVYGIVALL